jgi:hypothetical protein
MRNLYKLRLVYSTYSHRVLNRVAKCTPIPVESESCSALLFPPSRHDLRRDVRCHSSRLVWSIVLRRASLSVDHHLASSIVSRWVSSRVKHHRVERCLPSSIVSRRASSRVRHRLVSSIASRWVSSRVRHHRVEHRLASGIVTRQASSRVQ